MVTTTPAMRSSGLRRRACWTARRKRRQGLERQGPRLDRHDDRLRGGQERFDHRADPRRRVDHGVDVGLRDPRDDLGQLAAGGPALDLVDVLGGGDAQAGDRHRAVARRHHDLLEARGLAHQIDQAARGALAQVGGGGQAALGIGVDHQGPLAEARQAVGEVQGGRGLADPALLARDQDDVAHG
jgi:hypothetical protein